MPAAVEHLDFPVRIGQPHLVTTREERPTGKHPLSLAAMFGRCKWLPRGRHLFLAGDPFHHVHMVVNGSFKVYATSLDGEEQVLGFFLPGDTLGLEAAISQTHHYSAVALEDANVSELSLVRLRGELGNVKDQDRQELLQHLCFETIANNYIALHSRSTKFAEQRLSSFLLGLWDRHDATTQAGGELSLTMSRQDIGDYLGLALGTISRTFAQLEQQMLLKVRCRSVQMLDLDSLRRLACSTQKLPVDHV